MSLDQQIRSLEQDAAGLGRVVQLVERLLTELMKASAPPANLEQLGNFLRSASDLLKHGEQETAEQLTRQAEEALQAVREWLAVADLAISPFILRNFLEKNRLNGELQQALIQYFLRKDPRAENDRDKLDYLLSAYLAAGASPAGQPLAADQVRAALEPFFEGTAPRELGPASEIMLHEVESLIARVEDFSDFDQLVHARMVERARALKISLSEDFYHPRSLATLMRFNLTFRRHFEELFRQQLAVVRRSVQQHFEEAEFLREAIALACEDLLEPGTRPLPASAGGTGEAAVEPAPAPGQPLELEERPPIDRLVRRGEEPQKESDLKGIIHRIAHFVEKLHPDQAKAETLTFALRESGLELAVWEREAFAPAAAKAAPESTRTIQYSLGVIAWLQEEMVQYKKVRDDRYLWKTHFDLLSYAVARAVDLLRAIRELVRAGAPPAEAAWFGSLGQTAARLADSLKQVAPVFSDTESS